MHDANGVYISYTEIQRRLHKYGNSPELKMDKPTPINQLVQVNKKPVKLFPVGATVYTQWSKRGGN